MNETKVKGVVINSTDYKEKDKLVEIYTLENGLITAKLTGCKSANAKLKFAFQPFCFADFIIVEKNGFNNIISANLIDSFFDLTKNYENYQDAFKMLEIIKKVIKKGEVNHLLFILLLKCLQAMCYDKFNNKIILLKFIIETYSLLGYGLNFEKCADCGNKFDTKRYLKINSSEFVCSVCKDENCILIENAVFNGLRIIANCSFDKLNGIKLNENLLKDCEKNIIINLKNMFNIII